jgi:hypothetical protein
MYLIAPHLYPDLELTVDQREFSHQLFGRHNFLRIALHIAQLANGKTTPNDLHASTEVPPSETYRELRRLEELGAIARHTEYDFLSKGGRVRVDDHPIWAFVRAQATWLDHQKAGEGMSWKPLGDVHRGTERRRFFTDLGPMMDDIGPATSQRNARAAIAHA